jgi:hypothetical protein
MTPRETSGGFFVSQDSVDTIISSIYTVKNIDSQEGSHVYNEDTKNSGLIVSKL